ncbi:glycoside hydrolase family 61 protein [Phialemonium atrogriseum]|uniref:lytic cellulose monooxygenase (C4-dehydrogenating) n=1 Tax=Phialemonium atrogriseum TaxID=1093897 RepID=A0AAJ0BZM3_9PEZI|nr:glycoside hydrolase family 61 protein [Phialemonium atrogriseum]KAK1767230.1 glycoside hydrolase family 61 protein [Phialemonium atrogriseum]
MKLSTAIALALSAAAEAHYVFPSVGNTADWAAVRQTKNYQSNGPVTDVASPDMRCYQMLGATQIVNVTAGSTLAYNAKTSISHPGPMAFYIAKVPAGQSVLDWNADGKVWSKIYQDQPSISASSITWPSQGAQSVSVTIPKCLADGEYLLRAEHIGLHSASAVGGAQLYISCAQISVSGGSGTYAPKNQVAFPGAYPATDPGLVINIYYPIPTSYTPPGPAAETC